MGLDLRLTTKLGQRPVMTPQLQQAVKILQLPRGELDTLIDQELAENPVLERVTDDEEIFDDGHANGEAPDAANRRDDGADAAPRHDEIDWQTYLRTYNDNADLPMLPRTRYGAEDRANAPEDRFPQTESLAEHLAWQLRFRGLSAEDERLAALVIGNLDVDGYLETEVEELAAAAGVGPAEVEAVLRVIQSCDPRGVGARDLKECLLLQLDAPHEPADAGRDEALRTLAAAVVRAHLPDLEARRYARLAKRLGVEPADVQRARTFIARLEPKPGRQYGTGDVRYVTPDVSVHRVGEEYLVTLNEEGLPRLKVNAAYRNLLADGGEAKAYVQDKLRAAAWLIRSIHQRQRTLLGVAQSLVRFQRDFLDRGVAHLRPLVLRDVADDVGAHESTVSRAIADKYIATPRGLYPLKKFFATGLKRRFGDDVSAESVKVRIREMIAAEDPRRPLSDDVIAKRLARGHVPIARRTVAKYRESLRILPSAKRKQVPALAE